jgi:hypothetical protein
MVRFSDDGRTVVVSFNAATDKAGYSVAFPCTGLLQFAGAEAASCTWIDASTIVISPVYVSSAPSDILVVNSAVRLVGSKVRAQCGTACSSLPFAEAHSVEVAAPLAPAAPTVALSVPTTINSCDALLVDLTKSAGSGNRPWLSSYEVTTSPANSVAAGALLSFLTDQYTIDPPVETPTGFLTAGLTYTIRARLCNFLGACSEDTASVIVSASQQSTPVAAIVGAKSRTVQPSEELVLGASCYVLTCGSQSAGKDLQIAWSAQAITSTGSSAGAPIALRTTSRDLSTLKLAPYTLPSDTAYRVTVTVATGSTSNLLTASASAVVQVQPSAVVARLAGGSSITQSVSKPFTLDASGSAYEGKLGAAAGLSFVWSCVEVSPMASASCRLPLPQSNGVDAQDKISITPGSAAAGSVYRVTVTATVTATARAGSTSVDVTVAAGPVPQITVSSTLSSLSNINTAQALPLLASVLVPDATCTAVWSVDDSSVALTSAASTPTTQAMQAQPAAVPFSLMVKPNTLPQRATLVFSLSCGAARTSITVTTNGAPLPGQFTLAPTSGFELSTLFRFSAASWSDTELPLTYLFGFVSGASLTRMPLAAKSEQPYASSVLAAGPSAAVYVVSCYAEIYDSLGANSSASLNAVVRPTADVNQVAYSQALLSTIGAAPTVDGLKRAMAVASTAINAVNCTAAPKCASLNRKECSTVAQTCGPCLAGYLGDSGDQNAQCYLSSVFQTTPNNIPCTVDASCLSWQRCDVAAGVCQARTKSCPNGCSGRGRCSYISTSMGTALSAVDCSVSSLQCEAKCRCANGYSGNGCELSNAEQTDRLAVRAALISILQNMTTAEDPTEQSIASWSAGLQSLVQRPSEIASAGALRIIAIANFTINSAKENGGIATASLAGALEALDVAGSVLKDAQSANTDVVGDGTRRRISSTAAADGSSSVNNTASTMVPLLDLFAELLDAHTVSGQDATSYIYGNFRVTNLRGSLLAGITKISLSVPQTDVERTSGSVMSSVVLVPSSASSGATTEVGVSIITVLPTAYTLDTSHFDADPIRVKISSNAGQAPSDFLSAVQFTFQHNPLVQRAYYESADVTSHCLGAVGDEVYTHVCPGSLREVSHNCTGRKGYLTTTCPYLEPSCAQLSVATAATHAVPQCALVASNQSATVCSCSLQVTAAVGRRLDEALDAVLDNSGASNMAAVSIYTAESFADTFQSADEFTSLDALAQVLTVVYLFAGLWGAGFVSLTIAKAQSDRSHSDKLKKQQEKVTDPEATTARSKILSYIEEVIPQVYAEGQSRIGQMVRELRLHHRYMTLFTLNNDELTFSARAAVLVKVLTVDTMQFFLLAVLYDLQYSDDDGSCVGLNTQSACLSRKTIVDDTQPYCEWALNARTQQYECAYHSPHASAWTFVIMFVFVSVITSAMNVPIDYLFGVCVAPTASSIQSSTVASFRDRVLKQAAAAAGHMARNVRRLSAAASSAVAPIVSQFNKQEGEAYRKDVVTDRSVSESLRAVHSDALAILPRLSIQAELRRRDRHQTAQMMRGIAHRKRSSMKFRGTRGVVDGISSSDSDRSGDDSDCDNDGDAAEVRGTELVGVTSSKLSVARAQLNSLCEDIATQRVLLQPGAKATQVFDAQWGVEQVRFNPPVFNVTARAKIAIEETIAESNETATTVGAELSHATVHDAGLTVLHLFIQDVLGRHSAAAKIFSNKFDENFAHVQSVSLLYKCFAILMIILSNVFFIYFTMLKAFVKGNSWQNSFVAACVVQMVVEITLNETVECLWLNYWVPNLVTKEVGEAVAVVKAIAEEMTNETGSKVVSRMFLNAPSYLFASTKVAAKNPDLLESAIVLNYVYHLPGEVCKTWPHCAELQRISETEQRRESNVTQRSWSERVVDTVVRTVSYVVTALLITMKWTGTLNFAYQRVILRFVQPLLFCGLTMLCYFSVSSTAGYAVFGIIIVVAAAGLLWASHRRQAADTLPQAIVPDDDLDAELEKEVRKATRGGGVSRSNEGSSGDSCSDNSSDSDDSDSDSGSSHSHSGVIVRDPRRKYIDQSSDSHVSSRSSHTTESKVDEDSNNDNWHLPSPGKVARAQARYSRPGHRRPRARTESGDRGSFSVLSSLRMRSGSGTREEFSTLGSADASNDPTETAHRPNRVRAESGLSTIPGRVRVCRERTRTQSGGSLRVRRVSIRRALAAAWPFGSSADAADAEKQPSETDDDDEFSVSMSTDSSGSDVIR